MTQSPQKTRPSTSKSANRGHPFLVFLFRLLLLVVGGGFAWLLGVAIAYFYPNPNPEEPLLEKGIRRLEALKTSARQNLPVLGSSDAESPTSPNPAALPSPAPNASPTSALTPEQRQQLQTEIDQLQAELATLRDRAATLENQIDANDSNDPNSAAAIEARIQALSQQLSGSSAPPSSSAIPSDTNQAPVEPASELAANPLEPVRVIKVTLPSDRLFVGKQSSLNPGAAPLLNSIITDLQSYEGATVRIGAHTDETGEAQENRELSYQQAQAVQQYLANAAKDQFRWVIAGYGETRPLVANTTESDRQRNRRVEITISP